MIFIDIYNKAFQIIENIVLGEQSEPIIIDATFNADEIRLVELLNKLIDDFSLTNSFAKDLANGNLDVTPPSKRTYMAANLKEIQSNYLHFIWKVDQITKGNYGQKIDFMGKLADSFNRMTDDLRKKENQLYEYRDILDSILKHSEIMVFVIDSNTKELYYSSINGVTITNEEDIYKNKSLSSLFEELKNYSYESAHREWDLQLKDEHKWYLVKSVRSSWNKDDLVYFHILFDESQIKKLEQQLDSALMTDTKTGVFNQKYALKRVSELIDSNSVFSVIFFDLDNLKHINDNYGHDAGDELIMSFINLVNGTIRADDRFCRMGGDEFVLILYNVTEQIASEILIRMNNKANTLKQEGLVKYSINYSYGIEDSVYICSCLDELSDDNILASTSESKANLIINSADSKMYENKKIKKQLAL